MTNIRVKGQRFPYVFYFMLRRNKIFHVTESDATTASVRSSCFYLAFTVVVVDIHTGEQL